MHNILCFCVVNFHKKSTTLSGNSIWRLIIRKGSVFFTRAYIYSDLFFFNIQLGYNLYALLTPVVF